MEDFFCCFRILNAKFEGKQNISNFCGQILKQI